MSFSDLWYELHAKNLVSSKITINYLCSSCDCKYHGLSSFQFLWVYWNWSWSFNSYLFSFTNVQLYTTTNRCFILNGSVNRYLYAYIMIFFIWNCDVKVVTNYKYNNMMCRYIHSSLCKSNVTFLLVSQISGTLITCAVKYIIFSAWDNDCDISRRVKIKKRNIVVALAPIFICASFIDHIILIYCIFCM